MIEYDIDNITSEQLSEIIVNINNRQYTYDEIYYIARLLYMILVKRKVPPTEIN